MEVVNPEMCLILGRIWAESFQCYIVLLQNNIYVFIHT